MFILYTKPVSLAEGKVGNPRDANAGKEAFFINAAVAKKVRHDSLDSVLNALRAKKVPGTTLIACKGVVDGTNYMPIAEVAKLDKAGKLGFFVFHKDGHAQPDWKPQLWLTVAAEKYVSKRAHKAPKAKPESDLADW